MSASLRGLGGLLCSPRVSASLSHATTTHLRSPLPSLCATPLLGVNGRRVRGKEVSWEMERNDKRDFSCVNVARGGSTSWRCTVGIWLDVQNAIGKSELGVEMWRLRIDTIFQGVYEGQCWPPGQG